MLRDLRSELVSALEDVETKLDELGGSASTVSTVRSTATAKSKATAKSFASTLQPSIAE